MAEAVEKAYWTIREGIASGLYPEGSHITAKDLGAASGLSRTPVREAMRRLQSEGLIQIHPNRGAFVTSWSTSDVEQYFDVVVALETLTADLAARNAADEHLARLRELNAEMSRCIEIAPLPISRIKALNEDFHRSVWLMAGNERVVRILESMIEPQIVFGIWQQYQPDELHRTFVQHQELVTALEARDPVWAKNVMTMHLLSARHVVLRSIRDRKD